jgi:hypothetical protein
MNTSLMESSRRATAAAEMGEQYSLAKILGIWALATVTMGILSWIVFPALSPISHGSAWRGHQIVLLGRFDLIVVHPDHRAAGGGRSPLGNGQAQTRSTRRAILKPVARRRLWLWASRLMRSSCTKLH